MADLETVLAAQLTAAEAFKAAALAVPDDLWNVPRAPGKWSPAQLTDHVAVATRVARGAMSGNAKFGAIPKFLRWLPRKFYLDKVLREGALPKKSGGPPAFAPAHQPMPRPELCTQLDSEIAAFAQLARDLTTAGHSTFEHGFFGTVQIADYVRFNALHLDHHREQLPGAK
jgi:hypothetical protein